MKSYFAFHGNVVFPGGFVQCVRWAVSETEMGIELIKIAMARAGEANARIIAEVDAEGFQFVSAGRVIPIKRLRELACPQSA